MDKAKDLEIRACKEFICPNLGLIEQKGKELYLSDETIKRAKDLAIEYLKKTYHTPHYSHIKYLLPSFLYMASILDHDRRFQDQVAEVFGISTVTIRKWNEDIMNTMERETIL